jgi:hypothetical protein
MTRSKLSTKVLSLAGGIGVSIAALAGSQPAAAQRYYDEQPCPLGTIGNPAYGCTMPGGDFWPYYYSNGYSGYPLSGAYGAGVPRPGVGGSAGGMAGGVGHGGGGGHR